MSNTIRAKKTDITDTTLRDARQSLLVTRIRTEDMLLICGKLNRVGYWSPKVWGGAASDTCVRFLKEDSWGHLRRLKAALPNTRLQVPLRGQNLLGYRHYSDNVMRASVAKATVNDIDMSRIFDTMSDVRNLRISIETVKAADRHTQGTICYITSLMHTIEVFIAQGRAVADMDVDSIAIKDMAGLLTPYATGDLVKTLKDVLPLDVVMHSHDTAGVVDMCQLKAAESGADRIDTAISDMTWGTSHPDTESMVAALRGTPYDTGLNLELIQEIGMYFHVIHEKYYQFENEFISMDTRVRVNQVPGGMISNLANQPKEQDALNRMDEVLEEIPRVRADLGFSPLVTPTSQIVGTQAFFNVLTGERYKTITNEVKLYLQGRYDKAPGKVNEQLRRQTIGSEEVIDVHPADLTKPELNKLHNEIGNLARSEEDILTYAMFPDTGRKFLERREAGTLKPEELLPIPTDKGVAAAGAEGTPTKFIIDVYGGTYRIDITGIGVKSDNKRRFHLSINSMPEEVVFESLSEYVVGSASGRKHANGPGHVSTTILDNIVDVLVKEDDSIKAGQTVLIIEVMKMETEVQAGITDMVEAIYVAKGDRVNPGKILIEIAG